MRGGYRPGSGRKTNAERALARFTAEVREIVAECPELRFDPVSDADWEQMTNSAPPGLRDSLRAIGEQSKAMKEFARKVRDGEVVLMPTTWGGRRPGAGRPIGAKNRPDYLADKKAAVRARKLRAD
jgi:hypothetical protein